jgi:cytochrome c-type biogenesis protein CcmH/NrfG
MLDRISGVFHAAAIRFRLLMPYVALAVLVPGGSVLAILLWLQVQHPGKG